jgi:hypothetical protein
VSKPGATHSRRQLILGAASAVGVAAAASAARITDAAATQGSPVLLGQDNTGATSRTGVFVSGNTEGATLADSNVSGKGNVGVYGYGRDAGVHGESSDPNGNGVTGVATGFGHGVQGSSSGSGGAGVWGNAAVGAPVGDVGVVAIAAWPATALQVVGMAMFDRSGSVQIAAPAKSAVVNVQLTSSSLVLATVQNSVGSSVAYVAPNVAARSFTVVLNKAPASGKTARVAWFVVN